MTSFLNNIQTLLDMNHTKKYTYKACLDGNEMFLHQALADLGYDPEKQLRTELFKFSTDARLRSAQITHKKFKEDNVYGIGAFVKHSGDVLHDFLKKYPLGHLSNMGVEWNGFFQVEIVCDITPPLLQSTTVDHLTFEYGKEELKTMGFEFGENKRQQCFLLNTAENQQLLRTFFSKRDAKNIEINILENKIKTVSFYLNPTDVDNFEVELAKRELPITDELNADECRKLRKNIAEIYSSLSFAEIDKSMVQTCGYLAESYFAEICEIVGYEGTIAKRVRQRYETERGKNMSIHEINKEMGKLFDSKGFGNAFEQIQNNLRYWAANELHSSACGIKIERYGDLSVEIKWAPSEDDLLWFVDSDDENAFPFHEDKFSLLDSAADPRYKYLKDCKENKEAVMDMVRKIDQGDVASFVTTYRNECGDYVIDHVNLYFSNAAALLDLNPKT